MHVIWKQIQFENSIFVKQIMNDFLSFIIITIVILWWLTNGAQFKSKKY